MSKEGQANNHSRGERELRIALILTLGMMGVEFVVGWLSRSLSLLADAGHMLTDALALSLSLFAAWVSARPATPEKTYGYYRTEILAALANGIALWLIVIWIYVQAIFRLQHPLSIQAVPMISVALLGLIVNLVSGRMLMGGRAHSLNLEGAWLNVMSDALGSLGVVIAGVLIQWFGWTVADSIASMVIGVLIAANSWNLIKRSVNILLEGTPIHLQTAEVVSAMRAISGVRDIHDVHLWTITTGMDAMSGHVIVENIEQGHEVLAGLNRLLSQRFGISHTTLQLESPRHACQPGGHV